MNSYILENEPFIPDPPYDLIVDEYEVCDLCNGSGEEGSWEFESCPKCKGTGAVLVDINRGV